VKTVYLAGTMAHDWRVPVKRAIEEAGASAWLPQDNPQQSAALYVPKDLEMARDCDALLAVIDATHSAWGTHAEMGVAFSAGKPIWLVWCRGPHIYSFSAVMAYKVFTDLQPAVDDLIKFLQEGIL